MPSVATAIEKLKIDLDVLAKAFDRRGEQSGDALAVVMALIGLASAEQPLAFGAAESVAMSAATLLTAEYEQQGISPAQYQQASQALDGVYATVGDERSYRATAFVAALAQLAAALTK